MRSLTIVFVLLLSLFISPKIYAQIPLSEKAKITLLTCEAGEELYSVFGHTAIRVSDPSRGMDVVYNFGSFDFNTPNFYMKFVEGDLQYFVSIGSYSDFLREYQYYDRTVYEQELILKQVQKQAISDELSDILLSDKRFYRYKFIDRNCTTMVADVITDNIDGEISLETAKKGETNRAILYSYLNNHFYERLGINLVFGYKTDKVADKLFLPLELKEGVSNTSINNTLLAKPAVIINQGSEKQQRKTLWDSIYSFAIAIGLLIYFTKNKTVLLSYIIISGLAGIFFSMIGFYSLHQELSINYNILLINPLFLLLSYFLITKKTKATKVTTYTCMILLAIYIIFMLNKPHMVIIFPLVILNLLILVRVIALNKTYTLAKTT
ncbi:MAG: hypothetical protein BM557_04155 [Flavobacterium sp. MedPE-SWcel]|nr:MAG: hypothetical protein BM557_04155 [Flavobacterium sp. MedPE-SWcel]